MCLKWYKSWYKKFTPRWQKYRENPKKARERRFEEVKTLLKKIRMTFRKNPYNSNSDQQRLQFIEPPFGRILSKYGVKNGIATDRRFPLHFFFD